jgi:hypothetical protein
VSDELWERGLGYLVAFLAGGAGGGAVFYLRAAWRRYKAPRLVVGSGYRCGGEPREGRQARRGPQGGCSCPGCDG